MQGTAQRAIEALALLAIATFIFAGCTRAKPSALAPRPEPSIAPAGGRLGDSAPTQAVKLVHSSQEDYPAPATATATATVAATATATSTPTPTPTATEEPPTATPTSEPCKDTEHVVQTGDTLTSLAEEFNTTVDLILLRNNLANPNCIYVGQKLIIPENCSIDEPHTVQHTVREGETLSSLARLYRTTVDAILHENPSVTDPQHLRVGSVLTITTGNEPALRSHIVRPGESIFSIARRYGVSVQNLVQFNGLVDPNHIYVGQRLFLP